MSRIYDNWERLVGAVLKREEFRQLARCDSIESTPSDFSPGSSSRFDELLNSTKAEIGRTPSQIESERIKEYEPGVHITLVVARRDGTTNVVRLGFRGTVKEQEAITWWLENRERVLDEKYNPKTGPSQGQRSSIINLNPPNQQDGIKDAEPMQFSKKIFEPHEVEVWWVKCQEEDKKRHNATAGLARIKQSAISNRVPPAMKELIPRNKTTRNPNELMVAHGRNKEPILETNFNEVLTSANLDGPLSDPDQATNEWVERYEPGVYVTLVHNEDGINHVERVRFSQKIFEPDEAEAWWAKNREKVYLRYKKVTGTQEDIQNSGLTFLENLYS